MLVKDLIRDTVWLPGADYDVNRKPEISVLLPTFRRGKSGMFRRAVESVLNQTLENIELIIIDDASTDGTADQIAEFQKRDGRVSCLRHTKNIGLPAISEFEGYLRARADRLAFAFDDTIFNPEALEELLAEAKKTPWAVIYGHVEFCVRDPATNEVIVTRLGSERSQGTLRAGNFIPNNGILMSKSVVEDVGFYDPHIVIARLCDWDLWCRVAERYEIRFVDVAVGREEGPMTTDSLGHTYSVDFGAADEWMRTARNERLRPANLPMCEVLAEDPSHGMSTRTITESVAKKHSLARGWPSAVPAPDYTEPKEGYILVVNLGGNASTSLYFELLPQDVAKRVRVISYYSGFGVEELARATCVIFVRAISSVQPWIDAAKAIGVPTYFFIDDNLPLLTETGEYTFAGEDYRLPAFRESVKQFEGVLVSSPKLEAYFEQQLLHPNVIVYPVACEDQRPFHVDYQIPKEPGEITIAFAGGVHRTKGLWDAIIPALKRLASGGVALNFVIPETHDSVYLDQLQGLPEGMRVTMLSFEVSYVFAMRRFARFSPDFVVHAPSTTLNNEFKTLHPLLTAKLLNAVPVMPGNAPYTEIADLGVAAIVNDAFVPRAWYQTFKDLVERKYDLDDIKARNSAYCSEHFSSKPNVAILSGLLEKHGGEPGWAEQSRRLHKLAGWMRATAGLSNNAAGAENADEQANQLAAMRRMVRYSWRHRILHRKSDLWDSVSPQFAGLKRYSANANWRKGGTLELSDALHDVAFREYRVEPGTGSWRGLSLAVAVDWVRHGLIGVELVAPDDQIKDNVSLDLARIDVHEPVRFDFTDVKTLEGESWRIRVFVRSKTPVYVYEFINRRLFGARFAPPTPFMELFVE
ncbi:hypothetical protein P3T18_001495 [Paraburkholderia sp. GAS199]|uniref:glycosyltransferase family 2 protein n=1 Tax=Paraburkholderia sp. GAS199 TaxID=3035126 RepID=UPI003D243D39